MIPEPNGQLAELIVNITPTRVDLYSHQILLELMSHTPLIVLQDLVQSAYQFNTQLRQKSQWKVVSKWYTNYHLWNIPDMNAMKYIVTICLGDRPKAGNVEYRAGPVFFKVSLTINTMRPRQNDRHFTDDTSNAFSWMKMFEFWLKFH